jgi:hypothetical protein
MRIREGKKNSYSDLQVINITTILAQDRLTILESLTPHNPRQKNRVTQNIIKKYKSIMHNRYNIISFYGHINHHRQGSSFKNLSPLVFYYNIVLTQNTCTTYISHIQIHTRENQLSTSQDSTRSDRILSSLFPLLLLQ